MKNDKYVYGGFITPRQKLEWISERLIFIANLLDDISDQMYVEDVKRL